MIIPSGFRVKFCFLVTAILVVGGCQPQTTHEIVYATPSVASERYTDAESLLSSDGYLNLVDDKADVSPLEQHMNARKQVKPGQVRGQRAYTGRGETVKETTHFRTLRLASNQTVLPTKKPGQPSKPTFITSKPKLLTAALDSSKQDAYVAVPSHKPDLKVNDQSKPSAVRRLFAKRTPPVAPESSVVERPAPVKALSSESTVKSIRLGEHPGKTRFVLDLTGPSAFDYELNNQKGYLLIDLPGTDWDTNKTRIFTAHTLVKGYSVRSNAQGSKLLVALKKPGRLITSVTLPPNASRGHRIYFDIGEAKG